MLRSIFESGGLDALETAFDAAAVDSGGSLSPGGGGLGALASGSVASQYA